MYFRAKVYTIRVHGPLGPRHYRPLKGTLMAPLKEPLKGRDYLGSRQVRFGVSHGLPALGNPKP